MKNKLFNIANMPKYGYINRALGKISKLALTGYKFSLGVQSVRAFFVRKISMRPHRYVELGRDTFECASYLDYWSANPFQLCHPYLAVIGRASKSNLGAHSHA